MFVLFDPQKQRLPIKIWLRELQDLEAGCLKQAINLANLPFLKHWVVLMPDTHQGYGMPIGGVIAAKDVIIPNAVGVDIGCGMAFVKTNLSRKILNEQILSKLIHKIMEEIPTGFDHHPKPKPCKALDDFAAQGFLHTEKNLEQEIPRGYYQVGTLGGGNHFIEIQADEEDRICIMLHSGSRNLGYQIARYFNEKAKNLMQKDMPKVPPEYDLAYLPIDSKEGQHYLLWMNLALDFARENREKMLNKVQEIFTAFWMQVEFGRAINAHHNYAAKEKHYTEEVWVHRKGAIRVEKDELGIIPGAMGSYSYIVRGLGNPESFCSCSHGAGRKIGRKEAQRRYSMEETLKDLKAQGVLLGKKKKKDLSEEVRFAYKDIDEVIKNELDLIEPIKKLTTVAVIKG